MLTQSVLKVARIVRDTNSHPYKMTILRHIQGQVKVQVLGAETVVMVEGGTAGGIWMV
jgi:hypothetical protein